MARPYSVLVIDDEPSMREVLRLRLAQWDFEVTVAESSREGARMAEEGDPDIVVCDVVLPDGSGLDLLPVLRTEASPRPVVIITAHGSIDAAVEAVKRGAMDFLTKPLDYQKFRAVLDQAVDEIEERRSTRRLEDKLARSPGLGPIIGTSKPMRELYRLIKVLAASSASALITGESGTGKELVARAVHDLGERSAGPFVAVNAAAIPEGLLESELFGHEKGAFTGAVSSRAGCFEQADKGTLFLDEIAEMPASLQPKFLRTLENGRVRRLGASRESAFDVRLLAATNRVPEEAVAEGLLRADLYYRLNVFTLVLPPLRDRAEDVPLLAQHFLARFNEKHGCRVEGIRLEALDLLKAYPWPGNVRELRNVLERAVILAGSGWVEDVHLPSYVRNREGGGRGLKLPPGLTMAEAERLLIMNTLDEAGGNKAEAARRLGLDVKTIRNKLKSYGEDDTE